MENINRGKWSESGVPHKGWVCYDVEDLGEPDFVCEMCEEKIIRYVHTMRHPEYPTDLRCGCICAGNMEENVSRSQARERTMKNWFNKRKKWLTRKWKRTMKGNFCLRTDGFRIIVYPRGSGWGWTVVLEWNNHVRHGEMNYGTMDRAKLAAFDHATKVKFILQSGTEMVY